MGDLTRCPICGRWMWASTGRHADNGMLLCEKNTRREAAWFSPWRKTVVWCVLALLLCGGRAVAQDVPLVVEPSKIIKVDRSVIVPTDVLTANKFPFRVTAPAGGALYRWQYPSMVTAVARGGVLEISAAPAGEITFAVEYVVVDFDKKKLEERFGRVSVLVGDSPPGPKPPEPKPPEPGIVKALRVLIVYESADLTRLKLESPGQYATLYAKSVRDYLKARCAKEADGWSAYRIYDKDADTSAEPRGWAALLARPRSAVPWVVIADGDAAVYEGPLPASVDATLTLLKKYGGV